VAFPLISGGSFGYPKEEAFRVAVEEITRFLANHELYVVLVVYGHSSFRASRRLIDDIIEYIDDVYVEAHYVGNNTTLLSVEEPEAMPMADRLEAPQKTDEPEELELSYSMPQARRNMLHRPRPAPSAAVDTGAPKLIFELDESFSQMLLRKIDEKGMTDAECYKKANIDRKLFSKIRKDPLYKPSKTTAIAFAIALELPLPEAKDLLEKAGFALSHSNKFDIIIEYFIKNGNYNIYDINEVLFEFDQSLLGA